MEKKSIFKLIKEELAKYTVPICTVEIEWTFINGELVKTESKITKHNALR